MRTYPYMAVDAFGECIWSLKVTPGICHRESSLLRPKFHRLSGQPGCAHRLQCCLVFQSPKNALLYSCFPLQSWHIPRDQGICHSITSSCPLPSPPFSSRCCFSPRRDFLLVDAGMWLIFLTFESGFDSETFGSLFVQCLGKRLLLTVGFR